MRRGKSRQQARGHMASEHVYRKLPPPLRKQVRKAARQNVQAEREMIARLKEEKDLELEQLFKEVSKRIRGIWQEVEE